MVLCDFITYRTEIVELPTASCLLQTFSTAIKKPNSGG
jgi:hypothetical protein